MHDTNNWNRKMIKALYVATVVRNHIMEFHIPYLKMMKEMGWQTAVAAGNDYDNKDECLIPYCDEYYDISFSRKPFDLNNIVAYKKLKELIETNQYDIIHCHTPVAATLTRLAAINARKHGSIVIYTAHGFHFYNGAPILYWLTWYPIERLLAKLTDILITINSEDYERARAFRARKVELLPGVGIDTEKYCKDDKNRIAKRKELNLKDDDFVIVSVGELIPRKNHKVVIESLGILKNEGILDGIEYVICGSGRLEKELNALTKKLNIAEHVHFLGYRNDVKDICNIADLFVFMSKQEGLPVALMEAMACGLPILCSNIRGNRDLIRNKVNGEFVSDDPNSLYKKILSIKEDNLVRKQYSEASIKLIKDFDTHLLIEKMKDIYFRALNNR